MSTDATSGTLRERPDSLPAKILTELRRSFFLSLSVFGIVLVILGVTVLDGVLAGMFGIWGGTAFLIGAGTYALTLVLRE